MDDIPPPPGGLWPPLPHDTEQYEKYLSFEGTDAFCHYWLITFFSLIGLLISTAVFGTTWNTNTALWYILFSAILAAIVGFFGALLRMRKLDTRTHHDTFTIPVSLVEDLTREPESDSLMGEEIKQRNDAETLKKLTRTVRRTRHARKRQSQQ